MLWFLGALLAAASPFDAAEPIPRLASFLEAYVGACPAAEPAGRACRREVQETRRAARGAFRLEGDARTQLTVQGVDEARGVVRVRVLPFWSEDGYGLTVGRPRRLDAQGNPMVRTLDLEIELPEDEPAFMARRRIEMGRVRLEWVIRPVAPWSLPKADGTPVQGVAVKAVAFRVVEPRSGELLAEKTW